MSSFIFDNFKKRFLTGGVPQTDTWHFIPVNEDFKTVYEHDDVKLYHYRNINDFNKANSSYLKFTLSPEAKKFNDELTTEYSKLYNYIANSHLMKKYIEDYKAMMFTQNSMVETYMDSFK